MNENDPEKMNVQMVLDTDHNVARLIVETAQFLGKCPPARKEGDNPLETVFVVRTNAELIREAADLVFLALSLIAEKRQ